MYDKCALAAGDARSACQLDKALVNVGALFLDKVEGGGRVSTEVDPRLAYDTGGQARIIIRHWAAPTLMSCRRRGWGRSTGK